MQATLFVVGAVSFGAVVGQFKLAVLFATRCDDVWSEFRLDHLVGQILLGLALTQHALPVVHAAVAASLFVPHDVLLLLLVVGQSRVSPQFLARRSAPLLESLLLLLRLLFKLILGRESIGGRARLNVLTHFFLRTQVSLLSFLSPLLLPLHVLHPLVEIHQLLVLSDIHGKRVNSVLVIEQVKTLCGDFQRRHLCLRNLLRFPLGYNLLRRVLRMKIVLLRILVLSVPRRRWSADFCRNTVDLLVKFVRVRPRRVVLRRLHKAAHSRRCVAVRAKSLLFEQLTRFLSFHVW